MKLIQYNGSRILYTVENIRMPVTVEDGVHWENGSVTGTDFLLLLDDNVEIGEEVTDELKALDRRSDFVKEVAPNPLDLKRQLAETNALILDFMESTLA
jgi:hypothetical protein